MSEPLVVVGGGGFGREVLDVVDAINRSGGPIAFDLLGVLDDGPSAKALGRLADSGREYLGTLSDWIQGGKPAKYVVAVGNPITRSKILAVLDAAPWLEPVTLIHPKAVLGSRVKVGAGSVICSGVQISTNVQIGRHVHINPGAIVGHDARLDDFVSVNPGAIISGDCHIGNACLVGAGAVILQHLAVGSAATVGAGAAVTRDVSPNLVVKGVPAR